jgi:hypothetical protein
MEKLDIKTVKPLYNTINHKVKDPVRYPKIINPYEEKMRTSFKKVADHLLQDLTKMMVSYKK